MNERPVPEEASALVPAPEVVMTDLGDEAMLLDPRCGAMYALNDVGRCVWLALGHHDTEQLVAAVCSAFEVDQARARTDVEALLAELRAAGLVRHADRAR